MTLPTENTPVYPASKVTEAVPHAVKFCEFELYVYSKYDDAAVEATGPTLAIAISHALPQLRHLAHSGAVFGARRWPEDTRSYGCWEIIFPEEDAPLLGYDQFAVRQSMNFKDNIEVFDVTEEFNHAEGMLRFRAQDMGDDEKSLQSISKGVREYIDAAHQLMLWDPAARLDIAEGLTDLFLNRDWSPFIAPHDLEARPVTVSEVELFARLDDTEWLVRFHYVNGADSGYEIEFADVKRGRLTVRRSAYSALRSPVPTFRGDQLLQVYDALQPGIDKAWVAKRVEMPWGSAR
ncbi:hypothetical protein J2Y63_004177 [Shinella sp. BE166]|uniref:hypothetical protein n=1 Tax=Shinella sp. BE166 TaxID=3373918 RepID=UPI003EB816E0